MPPEKHWALTTAEFPLGGAFPEARQAAEEGVDLWLLDAMHRLTPLERLKSAESAARLAALLRNAGRNKYGV